MTEETKVLDLGEVFNRDTVKLQDGTTHELRNPQEFSILDDFKLRSLLKRIDEFRGKKPEERSEQDAEQASKLMRELATMLIVGLDQETDLPDWACVAIFAFWTERASAGADESRPPKPRGRTTGASSRGSRRSTAATRKPGSPKSPAGR